MLLIGIFRSIIIFTFHALLLTEFAHPFFLVWTLIVVFIFVFAQRRLTQIGTLSIKIRLLLGTIDFGQSWNDLPGLGLLAVSLETAST